MSAEIRLSLANDFNELPSAAEKITDFLELQSASSEMVFTANLAVEELFTNIVKYGYDDQFRHEIHVHLILREDSLIMKIIDDGHEFNPFALPPPDTTLPVEERDIGGLGIHFVKNLLDTCTYERRDGLNIITLMKKV